MGRNCCRSCRLVEGSRKAIAVLPSREKHRAAVTRGRADGAFRGNLTAASSGDVIFLKDDWMVAQPASVRTPFTPAYLPIPSTHVRKTSKLLLKATRSARYPGAIRASSNSK